MTHHEAEIARFEKSVGMSIEDFQKKYNVEVFLQGDTVDYSALEKGKRYMFCFCKYSNFPYNKIQNGIKIKIPSIILYDAENDRNFDASSMPILFEDKYGAIFAGIDVNGHIHTSDFYHNEKPINIDWLMSYISDVSLNSVEIVKEILTVPIERIEKVIVKTKVDVKEYKQKVKKELLEKLEDIRALYETKINILKKQHEAEIENVKKAQIDFVMKGIEIGYLCANTEWEFKDGCLWYNRPITCKYIKKQGRIIEIPETRRSNFYTKALKIKLKEITEDLTVVKMYAVNAYHPNINYSGSGELCMGDLENKHIIEVLKEVPEMLETINLDSAYTCNATTDAEDMFRVLDDKGASKSFFDLETFTVEA